METAAVYVGGVLSGLLVWALCRKRSCEHTWLYRCRGQNLTGDKNFDIYDCALCSSSQAVEGRN